MKQHLTILEIEMKVREQKKQMQSYVDWLEFTRTLTPPKLFTKKYPAADRLNKCKKTP